MDKPDYKMKENWTCSPYQGMSIQSAKSYAGVALAELDDICVSDGDFNGICKAVINICFAYLRCTEQSNKGMLEVYHATFADYFDEELLDDQNYHVHLDNLAEYYVERSYENPIIDLLIALTSADYCDPLFLMTFLEDICFIKTEDRRITNRDIAEELDYLIIPKAEGIH